MGLMSLVKQLFLDEQELLSQGPGAITGRAITDTLFVSPGGTGVGGRTWATAFTNPADALDAASIDPNDCTLICIGPTATFYDINRTGDPTWAGNYEIIGTHRIWAPIRNNHATATSVMNFSGRASLRDMAIFTAGTMNGVSFSGNGWRIRNCGFNSTGLTGPAISVHIDGSAALTRGGIMEDVQFLGAVGFTTGIHNEQSTINEYRHVHIHECLVGVLVDGIDSDFNHFEHLDIGDSALGFDLDAGNEQHFTDISFHHNTRNVDDEVGDHTYVNIMGAFDIYTSPDNLVGIQINCGAAGVYGGDTELVAAALIDNPFRIVGQIYGPSANEWYTVRFSADAGVTFFDVDQFDANKKAGNSAPSGTEHIFNADTRISASDRSVTGGNNTVVWLLIQEI